MPPLFDVRFASTHNNRERMHIYYVAPTSPPTTKIRHMLNIPESNTVWNFKNAGYRAE